jgi:translocation and assembly module TamA
MWRCGASFHRWIMIAAAVTLALPDAHAADQQPYTVTIASTGERSLDAALKASSQLESLRGAGSIAPFALVGRAQNDVERLKKVLQGFGYYQGKVAVTIDGRPLADPGLVDEIESRPQDQSAEDPGPLYRLRKIALEGEAPPEARGKLGLEPSEPAVAANVLEAQKRLLTALQNEGYALATVGEPVVYEDPAAHALDVTFPVHAGPQVDVGEIRVTGLHQVNESLVRQRLLVHSGERYSPTRIESARQDLLALGVFSGVSVRAAEQLDAQGRIPITFDVQERPPHVVGLSAAYSTDLGISGKASWSHRNLFGNAEQLNLAASVVDIGGSATTGVGYNVTAQFVKPEFMHRDQQLELSLGALNQSLEAYDQKALTAGASVRRKFSERWSASAGIAGIKERITQEGETRDYTLLSFPVNAKYDTTGVTNPLEDALHGIRASATVTPTQSFGASSATFFIIQANASGYIDLAPLARTAPGRSVLAWRALIGTAQGASLFSLPPDQRFYGGGSATVRGYKYQSIGPLFPDNKPIGGTSIDAATLELRQRLPGNFAFATFVDAGQVGATSTPFTGALRVGAGLGVRYYTPIGPIRLDVAVPLNPLPDGDRFEIYIGLGQVF